ncbi:MAG: carboxylating nicotinate-nucleotide diphosphorylase [Bdellovibrionota bacterium]
MNSWKDLLQTGLEDDDWRWDWTTLGTLKTPEQKITARVVAKADGVWAATPLFAVIEELGVSVKSSLKDGARLKHGAVVCEWSGPARLVLAYERPFLNLAQYACGIATQTRCLVDRVERACPKRTPRVSSTRKVLPGYRELAIHGVLAGGGAAHRVSLSGGVLIKENHIAASGSIPAAIRGARAVAPHGLRVEIEVRSEKELAQALEGGADIVLLDNFTPAQVAKALARIEESSPRPMVEVSGGITEETIASYALEGVDVLSVGSLTHSVRALDLSMLAQGLK